MQTDTDSVSDTDLLLMTVDIFWILLLLLLIFASLSYLLITYGKSLYINEANKELWLTRKSDEEE